MAANLNLFPVAVIPLKANSHGFKRKTLACKPVRRPASEGQPKQSQKPKGESTSRRDKQSSWNAPYEFNSSPAQQHGPERTALNVLPLSTSVSFGRKITKKSRPASVPVS